MPRRTRVVICLLVLATNSFFSTKSAEAREFNSKLGTKFWVDCSSGLRDIDCVESVEFSDPKSERRDSKGFLDYASIVWKKANVQINPKFTYKGLPPETYWKQDSFGVACVGGQENWASVGGYYHDACYTARGLHPDGSDIVFHLLVNNNNDRLQIFQWVDKGIKRDWIREDGWVAQTVPDGSTWRLTFKSNDLAENTGVVTSNLKNPNITVKKGRDGVARTVIVGTVVSNQFGCKLPGKNFIPEQNLSNCKSSESYAETASTGFTVSISPYINQFESLSGYMPGGVFVSGSTGSLGEVSYDPVQAIITVPMFGPHYLFDKKTLNKGWMEAAVKGEVIRRAFKLDPSLAGNIVKVEITEFDGVPELGTYSSRYLESLDVFEIRVYNFGFSSPTLQVKFGVKNQKKKVKKSTIICMKEKDLRRITAMNPKCPRGWSKK